MNKEIFLEMLESIKKINGMLSDGESVNDVHITISLVNSDKVHAEYVNIKTHDEYISFWSNTDECFECVPYSSIAHISC